MSWIKEIQDSLCDIKKASDAINASFSCEHSGHYSVVHSCKLSIGLIKVEVELSNLLFYWGGQNVEGLDDVLIPEHCTQIASFVSSPHIIAQKAAIERACVLLSRFPCLCRYFDLSALRGALRDVMITKTIHPIELDAMHWVLREKVGIDDSLRRLSAVLPTSKIESENITLFIPAFLSFIAKVLNSQFYGMDNRFDHFLEQILSISNLFQFHDLRVDWEHPIVMFWETIKDDFVKRQWALSLPLWRHGRALFVHLRSRLKDTLRSLPALPDQVLTSESKVEEDFTRLCSDLFLRLPPASVEFASLADEAPWFDAEEVDELNSIMGSRFSMGRGKIEAIWKACHSNFILEITEQKI